jgi:hypothetical protein
MILNSQPSSESVSIRVNSWLLNCQWLPAPKLPIQPSLLLALFCLFSISCQLVPRAFVSLRGSFFSWSLRGYNSIMQNKPNFQNSRIISTHCATKTYKKNTPCLREKNKPNQTQSPPAIPARRDAIRNTQYEIQTQSLTHRTTYEIRHTTYEIRSQTQSLTHRTTYDIRHTKPNPNGAWTS